MLTELRDNDIPKLDSRIMSVLSITQQSVQVNKFNTSLKNVQTLLPNDITKLRNDLNEFIISLQFIPAQNFESNQIDTFSLLNEKLYRQYIDEVNVNNVF